MQNQSTNLSQHADMPPSFFDFENMEPPVFGAEATPIAAAPATSIRHPLKIARAISGVSEVRLLVEKSEGKTDVYILEQAQLSPYQPVRTELKRGDKPMSEKSAHAAFEKKVAELYPAELLRNGKSISRHLVLQ